jgi:hypothetical protein
LSQQSGHQRTYSDKLGENTGEIIPPRQADTPKFSKNYGNFYLFDNLAN